MIALLWILVLAIGTPAFAQEKLTATVDRTALRVGESVTLTIAFSGAAGGVSEPQFPPLENLQMVGGPYSSTNVSIVNGRVSSSASYNYVLRAKKPGATTIGPATVKYKGKEYTSNTINVSIQTGAAPGAKGAAASVGGGEDVYIRVIPDKTEAYLGEQITLSYKLYFGVQITSPELIELPNAAGFWIEDIQLPQQLTLQDEVINGRQYKTAVFRKSALFPTTSGELEVEPLVVSTKIERRAQRRSRDPFDMLFNDPFFAVGRHLEPVEVASPPLKLRIKPLPQAGIPTEFNGAVGSFKLSVKLDSLQATTDHAVTLTMQISGTGNIKTLPPPVLSIPADIERFDPETSEDLQKSGSRISGTKTFKYILIPRAPGVQVIPAVTLAFFDPEKGKYQTVSSPELRLAVKKGDGTGGLPSGIAVATKHGVETIATDIAFAKTRPGHFGAISGAPHQSAMFWLWSVAPWAILGAAFVGLQQREKKDRFLAGRKGGLLRAGKALDAAEHALKKKNLEEALRHVDSAVDNIVATATDSDAGSVTGDELREKWRMRELDPSVLDAVLEVQSACDRARFAAGHLDGNNLQRLIGQLRKAVERLGRAQTKMDVAS